MTLKSPDYRTYSNVLPPELLQEICNEIMYKNMFVYMPCSVPKTDLKFNVKYQEISFFHRSFYDIDGKDSEDKWNSNIAKSCYNAIKYYLPQEFEGWEIYRMLINILSCDPNYPEGYSTTPHVDATFPDVTTHRYKSIIFYLIDSDGPTVLFNESLKEEEYNPHGEGLFRELTVCHKNPPVANTAFAFDSERYHAAEVPRKHKERIVFNIVLKQPR